MVLPRANYPRTAACATGHVNSRQVSAGYRWRADLCYRWAMRILLLSILILGCDDGGVDADPSVDASSMDSGDADPVEGDAADPDARVEPDAAEPDANLDAAEPDAAEPDATAPDATEPDATEPDAAEPPAQPNVLLVISDDLGLDWSPCYGMEDVPPQPNVEALCERGLVFEHFWANPVCSPTRATLLTGRYAFRTGIGQVVQGGSPLDPGERTLPQALSDLGYRSALFGKWHLGGDASAPGDFGWAHFAGLLRGALRDYFEWDRTVDGETNTSRRYSTTQQVDDALAWLEGEEGPWFVQMAFNAPHTPFHEPPAELHTRELGEDPDNQALLAAMIESMDTEMGRLLAGVDLDNTVVIYMGDNGTDANVRRDPVPERRAKGTLYEGGIRVPMVAAGPGIRVGRVSSLVNSTDVFATIIELAGGDEVAEDSVSFAPYLDDADALEPDQGAHPSTIPRCV